MLHKAANAFSPFKLQHLHNHVRSALNLNIGSNATSNINNSASASASNALGGSTSQASGAGGAKWSAGRSYSYQAFGRNGSVPANATTATDASQSNIIDDDEIEEALASILADRSSSSAVRRPFASHPRTRSPSVSSLTRAPTPSSASTESNSGLLPPHALPRSSPYSFTQAQLQARYRHAFSRAKQPRQQLLITSYASDPSKKISTSAAISSNPNTTTTTTEGDSPRNHRNHATTAPSSPVLRKATLPQTHQVRRNSTSAAHGGSTTTTSPAQESTIQAASTTQSSPATLQTPTDQDSTSPLEFPSLADIGLRTPSIVQTDKAPQEGTGKRDPFIQHAQGLAAVQDVSRFRSLVRTYRLKSDGQSASRYAALISTSKRLIPHGISPSEVVDLHQDMIKKDFLPDEATQSVVVSVLCDRSANAHEIITYQQIQNRASVLSQVAESWAKGQTVDTDTVATSATDAMHSEASLAALKQQSDADYVAASDIFRSMGRAATSLWSESLSKLLACASTRGDIDIGLEAFALLEGSPKTPKSARATPEDFKNLVLTYAKAGEFAGLDVVFQGFLKGIGRAEVREQRKRRVAADLVNSPKESEENLPRLVSDKTGEDSDVQVWSAVIYGKLLQREGPAALELLEKMMASGNGTPDPTATTLLYLIRGFAETGDLDSAFRWAAKIHALPKPDDLPAPPAISETLDTILSSTASADWKLLQGPASDSSLLSQLGTHIQKLNGTYEIAKEEPTSTPSPEIARSESSSVPSYDLGSAFSDPSIRSQSLPITPPPLYKSLSAEEKRVCIDQAHSSMVDDLTRNSKMDCMDVYGLVKSGAREGVHAHPEALARLTDKLAHKGQLKPLQDVYLMAYKNIASLNTQQDQTAAWAYLEDRMLIAMAVLGDLQKAALHRDRLLKAGAAPSADAYAAMITSAKDTTDDATVALELFEESRRFGVVPNLYLFNILISKLSKARRTHLALSYFEQMKALGIRPSAVTYGSVIAACCRTGDEQAAEFLFNEMVRSPGFKARVPPYNTMMQFYITTRPNREKALAYFDAMLKARVAPTAHTYKLLLDAYGTPLDGAAVDIASVKDVFERLVNDPSATVTGVHWASLISAYGLGLRDVEAAAQLFDSIESHPASRNSKVTLPDVICFEALFNVFLANDRKDLIEKYLQIMQARFVRPTAYIYNTLIRAYGVTDIQKARDMFESLSDPSSGVAAPGNHATDKADSSTIASTETDTVYREPSTYEAMIRCEIAAGEKARAEDLLQRAVSRAFPAAVIARLSKLIKGGDEQAGPLFTSSATSKV